jgi:hypothetical protein
VSIATAVDADALMDLVGALRQLGATVSLPPDFVEAAYANGLAPYSGIGTVPNQLPFGQVLTETETQVLRYLPTHLTVQEIARELYRSADTVKTHLTFTSSSTLTAAVRQSEALRRGDSWPEGGHRRNHRIEVMPGHVRICEA